MPDSNYGLYVNENRANVEKQSCALLFNARYCAILTVYSLTHRIGILNISVLGSTIKYFVAYSSSARSLSGLFCPFGATVTAISPAELL